MNFNAIILNQLKSSTNPDSTSSESAQFLNSLNINKMSTTTTSSQRSYLYNNRLINSDNFATDYYYQSSKTWCNSQRDYCPLVIALISIVILITIVLIIYLCIKNSFECSMFRSFVISLRNKILKNSSNQTSRPSCNPSRSNLETLAALRNPTVSRASRSAFRSSSINDRNIWFIGNFSSKSTPPPPSYEESQKNARSSLTKLHTISVNQSAGINNAFSIESINESTSTPTSMFPSYRCIALSTSPNTRSTLQRLSTLSRQLLQENGYNQSNISNFVRVGTLNISNDEVPPSYETVVKNTQIVEAQISPVEILI